MVIPEQPVRFALIDGPFSGRMLVVFLCSAILDLPMKSTWRAGIVAVAVTILVVTQAQSDDPGNAQHPSAAPLRGKEPGDFRDDNSLKMKLVWCPPGFFKMENVGVVIEPAAVNVDEQSDDDFDPKDEPSPRPRQTVQITPVKVFLSNGYWLGKFEVTQSEYRQVMETEPWKGRDSTKEGADFPATWVSWNDAIEFCRKLTEQERVAGRLSNDWIYTLPTEAQWERACRARTETRFSFGDTVLRLGDYAWFEGNAFNAGEAYAHQVGHKRANPWGLFDMHGNAWEWCLDVYTEKLIGGRDPEVKLAEKRQELLRVGRGGGWDIGGEFCRSGFRCGNQPDLRFRIGGFRLALSAVR
jgi:formylglycine-generating enzyme required for sulfatase activity